MTRRPRKPRPAAAREVPDASPAGPEENEPAPPRAPAIPIGGVVAIVGRPNVGKSTLFNRLTGTRGAIVHDEPGVTRDRHYGEVLARGRRFALVDTGGFDPQGDDPLQTNIRKQIELALAEADVVVCVFDAKEEPTSLDHAELKMLRRSDKPVVFAVNKADGANDEAAAADYYRLGVESLVTMSAQHGRGVDALLDAILERLPPPPPPAPPVEDDGTIRVAIIGRPNAGKSSLVNRLLGEDRMIVDDQPGTTRDPVDSLVEQKGRKFLFIDTAGIRRKSKVGKADDVVEAASVIQAIRAMERAEVVLLMVDAVEGPSEQDAKVLGLAVDRGRAVVVGLNKIDSLDKKELGKAIADTKDKLSFAPWAEIEPLSAKTGRFVPKVCDALEHVAEAYRKRVSTGALNRFFEDTLATHPPPTSGGRAPRLFFITQAESSPPLFVVVASDPTKLHFSYRRYVQNQIRKTFAFDGVPVRVKYKERRRREKKS